MKKFYFACLVLIVGCYTAFSQNSDNNTAATKKKEAIAPEKEAEKDKKETEQKRVSVNSEEPSSSEQGNTSDLKDSNLITEETVESGEREEEEKEEKKDLEMKKDSEVPENPFLTGEDKAATGEEKQTHDSDTPENPFLAGEETVSADESIDEVERRGIDLLIDLGLGVSLSRFFIKPEDLTTEGKPSFLFNSGVIISFADMFFTGIAIRYMQLSVDLSSSYSTISGVYPYTSVKTNTNELLTYVSVPIKFGMRFELNKITPYFYADIEPAYLTGSNQFISKEIRTVFTDSSEYFMAGEKNTQDMETTSNRKRGQIFVGGSIGIEFTYGYGSVYIDGGCKYGIFDTDVSETQGHSIPWRNASSVIYFPVSLGIRFFL